MANTDRPRGFWAIRHLTGGQVRYNKYPVLVSEGSLLTKGDVAKYTTDGYVTLAAATIGAAAIGIFAYFEWKDADGKFKAGKQMPATKTGFTKLVAYVYDDPQIVFGVQADSGTAVTQADMGSTADHVATAADTTRKLSKHELDSSDLAASSNAQFKVIKIIDEPGNALGEHVNLEVIFNEHYYKAPVAAV